MKRCPEISKIIESFVIEMQSKIWSSVFAPTFNLVLFENEANTALVAGGRRGYKSVFCEKMLEASPMSHKANARWLQDGATTGQG